MDNKIKLTFDEKSPITGNFRVLVEPIELANDDKSPPVLNKICLDTGYHTYTPVWRDDNPDFVNMMNHISPESEDDDEQTHLRRLKFVAPDGAVWFPVNKTGIIQNKEYHDGIKGNALAILQPQFTDDTYSEFEWIILFVFEEEGQPEPSIRLHKTFKKLEFETALNEFVELIKSETDGD